MSPRTAFIALAVIAVVYTTGVGVGASHQGAKGFSLENPPGWLRSVARLMTAGVDTRTGPKEIREDTEGTDPAPLRSPVVLGQVGEESQPARRRFRVKKSGRSVRKLTLSVQDPHDVKAVWRPAGPDDPEFAFTLKPDTPRTITVLREGGRLTLEVEPKASARVRVE
jgi:hypothetical protein